MNIFKKLNDLSEKRIKYFLSQWDKISWYRWSDTYWEYLEKEIEEAKNEINTNRVYLEDELWDVLWDYLCLLNSLKEEWKIESVEKVLERAFTKYTWRINSKTWEYNGNWQEIKKEQKRLLDLELKKLNNN